MIYVEWQNNGKCESCAQTKPHCAQIEMEGEFESANGESIGFMLCSDCAEDLKKRLS